MAGMRRLAGIRVAVTGAATGIGCSVAERCVQEGARVAMLDIKGPEVEASAARVGAELAFALDVSDGPAVHAAVERIAGAFGGLDAVVNNAAVPIVGPAHALAEHEWDTVIDVNLKSIYLMAHAAWPHLKASGRGTITTTASIAGVVGTAGQAGYAVSKAGAVMLTRCLALDGAADGIRANAVSPGFVHTPMQQRYFDSVDDPAAAQAGLESITPLGRLGQPVDIADAFVYLISAESSWVTGHNLIVDGGVSVGLWGRVS